MAKRMVSYLLCLASLIGIFSVCAYAENIPAMECINGHEMLWLEGTPATPQQSGCTEGWYCQECGEDSVLQEEIYSPKTISISKSSYTYTGSALKPAVTVKDSVGKVIESSNYTVSYSSNTNIGTAKIKVAFKGANYAGSLSKSFKIVPKGTTIASITAINGGFKVTVNKQATKTTGYTVQYSLNKDFSSASTKSTADNTTLTKTVSGLKAGTVYYVRVRTYTKASDGATYCSAWSSAKSVKTLKIGVILTATKATMYVGGSKTLGYSVYPEKTKLTWKSSDKSVATVDANGKVKAIKAGTATITASFSYGGNTYKKTCKVTVSKPSVKIKLPTVPLALMNSSYGKIEAKFNITEVRCECEEKYNGKFDVTVYFAGKKTYDYRGEEQRDEVWIGWQLFDRDGCVVDSGACLSPAVAKGQKFKCDTDIYDLSPGTYTLELLSTN